MRQERKAEINELAQKLEADQNQRDADTARIAKLQEEIAVLREKNAADSQEVRRLEMKLLEKENEMRMTEKLLADFKENSGKWDKELENIQVQQDNSQNMIRQLEDKVTAKEAEVKAAEAKAVEQLDEYDSIKTQAEALLKRRVGTQRALALLSLQLGKGVLKRELIIRTIGNDMRSPAPRCETQRPKENTI